MVISDNFQARWVSPRLLTVQVYKVGDSILLKCLLVMYNKMFSDWTAVLILFVKIKRLQFYVLHLEESLWFYSETRQCTLSAHLSQRLKWAFDQTLSVVRRCRRHLKLFTFSLLLQNHWANFNQTWHKASLGPWVKKIQVCSNEGPHPFPRGDNKEIA